MGRPAAGSPRLRRDQVSSDMELVQSRIVTDDVERLAAFYARLAGVPVALNEYYVEVHTGPMSVGFSKRRFTEYHRNLPAAATDSTGGDARAHGP